MLCGKVLPYSSQLPCCLHLCRPADRYCATITGMLPSDPWKLAWAEQGYFFMEDLWQVG